jgi:2-iminoacetate synthase
MSFVDIYTEKEAEKLRGFIERADSLAVERALVEKQPDISDFCALISGAARPYLEEMACKSHAITKRRFGKTIQLYAPLYLSNECTNICTYCGFSLGNKIARKTLNEDEILIEARAVKALGFDHVLLVTGESSRAVGVEYIEKAIQLVRPIFSNISIEVQPLETAEYQQLRAAGLHSVLVYQETYDREAYKEHHPKGKKANFNYRLETPERIGVAGVHKIGIGALYGLSDWRFDAASVALHLRHLEKRFWQQKFSISFPRLRPAEGVVSKEQALNETDLVQLICAYRIWNENVELSLSTRESSYFRDNALPLGVTTMSAGSKTEPGGYEVNSKALKQFEIDDNRSPTMVAQAIRRAGYEPVWKDWDMSYDQGAYAGSL